MDAFGVFEENQGDFPRGCVLFVMEGWKSINFNSHPSGKLNLEFRQVCKEGKKGMLSNALHMKRLIYYDKALFNISS